MIKRELREDAVECQICKAAGKSVRADSLISHISHAHPGIGFIEYEDRYGHGIAPSLREEFSKKTAKV